MSVTVAGGWLPPQWRVLRSALGSMHYFCADCGTHNAVLRPDTVRWENVPGVQVRHKSGCPVLRWARSRRACDDMLRDYLTAYVFIADYGDEIVEHEAAR